MAAIPSGNAAGSPAGGVSPLGLAALGLGIGVGAGIGAAALWLVARRGPAEDGGRDTAALLRAVKAWRAAAGPIRATPCAEREKMHAERSHVPGVEPLVKDRQVAHDGCALYNRFDLDKDLPVRREILETLLGELQPDAPPQIEVPFMCDYGYNIKLGRGVFINFGAVILDCNEVIIGDGTLIGPGCHIATPNHPLDAAVRTSATFPEVALKVKIGRRCWFGSNVTVCPGVTIGDDVVVAAGAVVVKDIPSNSLVAGVPARIVRELQSSSPPPEWSLSVPQ